MRAPLIAILAALTLSGCAAVTVVDTAATVAGTAVSVTAKTVGAAVDVVVPDDD